MEFTDATKQALKARIALEGPAGSGKTWTAMLTAQELAAGSPFGVIDTERRKALLYSNDFRFKHLAMDTYDPRQLVKALALASQAGLPAVVIDSLTHFWSGADGMLEQVDRFAKRNAGGNQFGGWKDARPIERDMIDAILAYPGHVIVTLRVKTEYSVEVDERTGKKKPVKIGLKPDQREGLDYEFDVIGSMDLEHTLVITKSRLSTLADAVVARPDSSFGRAIADWLDEDSVPPIDVTDLVARVVAPGASAAELRAVYAEASAAGVLASPVMWEGEPTTVGKLAVMLGQRAAATEATPVQSVPVAAAPLVTPETADPVQQDDPPVAPLAGPDPEAAQAARLAAFDSRAEWVRDAKSQSDLDALSEEFRREGTLQKQMMGRERTLAQLIRRKQVELAKGAASPPDPFADAPDAGVPGDPADAP